MTATSHPGSDGEGRSASFDLLHEKVRKWIWRQGWDGLRTFKSKPSRFCSREITTSSLLPWTGKREDGGSLPADRLTSCIPGHRPG